MNRKRKTYILSCEISSIETVVLGGYEQKIAIEGKEKSLPIVITLHGGPGSPIPFAVGSRGLFPDITDRFIMVYWDQLGCGINNHKIDSSFTIDDFIKMTVDLIIAIRTRFPKNKLLLFGMSWGSILALHSVIRAPHLIDGVVTYGQIVKAPLLSDSAFYAVEQSAAPIRQKKFVKDLLAKRPNISLTEMMMLSRIVRKYTNGYINHASKPMAAGDIIKGLLFSPDYNFKDFISVFQNGYLKNGRAQNENLMREIAASDLGPAFNNIEIPYHVFQGESDVVTATTEVVKLLDELNNKNVAYSILPNVGHFPSETAMQKVFEKLHQLASVY